MVYHPTLLAHHFALLVVLASGDMKSQLMRETENKNDIEHQKNKREKMKFKKRGREKERNICPASLIVQGLSS